MATSRKGTPTLLGPMARTTGPSLPSEPTPINKGALLSGADEILDTRDMAFEAELDRTVVKANAEGNTKMPPIDDTAMGPVIEDPMAKNRTAQRIEKNTLKWMAVGQAAVAVKGDRVCAAALGYIGPEIAKNTGQCAVDIPWLAKFLDEGDKYAALVGLMYSVTQLAITIGAHHGLIPYNDLSKLFIPSALAPAIEEMQREHNDSTTNARHSKGPLGPVV